MLTTYIVFVYSTIEEGEFAGGTDLKTYGFNTKEEAEAKAEEMQYKENVRTVKVEELQFEPWQM